MSAPQGVSRWVLIRDLLIFQLKLSIDSVKDLLLSPLAIGAAILGVLFGGPDRGQWFYRLLRWGERFDLWLNLFGSAQSRPHGKDGLFDVSRAGEDTLLGQLELHMRGGDDPHAPLPVRRLVATNPFAEPARSASVFDYPASSPELD